LIFFDDCFAGDIYSTSFPLYLWMVVQIFIFWDGLGSPIIEHWHFFLYLLFIWFSENSDPAKNAAHHVRFRFSQAAKRAETAAESDETKECFWRQRARRFHVDAHFPALVSQQLLPGWHAISPEDEDEYDTRQQPPAGLKLGEKNRT